MDLSIIFGKYGEDILHFAASRSVNATALSSADFHFGGRRRRARAGGLRWACNGIHQR